MTRTRLVCACLLAMGVIAGFLCGRLSTLRDSTAGPITPPVPRTSPPAISAARLAEARAAVTDQSRLAGEVLVWLESLPRTLPDELKELPYDGRAVYHAIKFLGEVRYAPAVPFLVRELFENKLRIDDPDASWVVSADVRRESPILRALIQIGPPSAPPLVGEYLRFWKLPPDQMRDVRLSVIKFTLVEDALAGAALRHIHKWLVKANFAHIDREDLDALQDLKRELLREID